MGIGIRVDHYFHGFPQNEDALRQISDKLDRLLLQGEQLMADSSNVQAQLDRLNSVTNDMAAEIDSAVQGRDDLKAQIADLQAKLTAAGALDAQTQQAFDNISAKLGADADALSGVSDKLKTLGADPANPVPAPEPAPTPIDPASVVTPPQQARHRK